MLIKNRIRKKDCKRGYILDGFPRTMKQVKNILEINFEVNYIIEILTDYNTIKERISGRLVHESSGRTYHEKFFPPITKNRDNITGEKLKKRKDDNIKTLQNRIKNYEKEINEIREYFNKIEKNNIKKYYQIDGNLKKEEIYNKILNIIKIKK